MRGPDLSVRLDRILHVFAAYEEQTESETKFRRRVTGCPGNRPQKGEVIASCTGSKTQRKEERCKGSCLYRNCVTCEVPK